MARRKLVAAGLAAALALGLAGLLLAGSLNRTRQVQSLGVLPVIPVAPILPDGGEACERDVALAEAIDGLRFNVGTFAKPGPPLAVTVRSSSGRVLGSGGEPGGWTDDGTPRDVPVGRVDATTTPVSVCVRNRGRVKAWVWGDSFSWSKRDDTPTVRPTVALAYATVRGKRIGDNDLSLAFTSREPRSLIERMPGMFRHAAAFRPSFVGAWLYWLLLAAMLIGAPLLLLGAARRAADDDPGDDEPPATEPPFADPPPPARERVSAARSR